jgi:hypothetical protein
MIEVESCPQSVIEFSLNADCETFPGYDRHDLPNETDTQYSMTRQTP